MLYSWYMKLETWDVCGFYSLVVANAEKYSNQHEVPAYECLCTAVVLILLKQAANNKLLSVFAVHVAFEEGTNLTTTAIVIWTPEVNYHVLQIL